MRTVKCIIMLCIVSVVAYTKDVNFQNEIRINENGGAILQVLST